MKPFVRSVVGVSFGIWVMACTGGGEPARDPGLLPIDDENTPEFGHCGNPLPSVLDPSGTLVLSGTFRPGGSSTDPCIGDAPTMVFAVEVPDDGTLEIQARTPFPASIAVREDCEGPGRTALCNQDVGRTGAFLPVSGTRQVFVTIASLSTTAIGDDFEISIDFHPVRKSGDPCDSNFLCESGTFCNHEWQGVCIDLLRISDAQMFHGGAEANEHILSFGVNGPMGYVVSYELEITDVEDRTEVFERNLLFGDDVDSFFLRHVLHGVPENFAATRSARFRVSNGGWTDWVDVDVVQQPLRKERQACDPHAVVDRCDVGLACAGPAEGAICLPTDEARIVEFERAPSVNLNGSLEDATSLRVTSSGRGVWDLPSPCLESLPSLSGPVYSLPEAVVRLSIGEGGATVGLMPNADILTVLRYEGGQVETIACGFGYSILEDLHLEEGEYAIVVQSFDKRVAPAWNFGLSLLPPLPD